MENFLKQTLPEQFDSIVERVQERISKEMKFFVNKIEAGLSDKGRCLICTLKTPCKHSDGVKKVDQTREKVERCEKVSYWKVTGRELSVPLVDIEKLEKIERFRENRMSQDLEKLNEMKKSEEKDVERRRGLEMRRVRYVEDQKAKLNGYQEELKEIRRKIREERRLEIEEKKREEGKVKGYLEVQKKKILEKEGQGVCSIGFFRQENRG